MSTPDWKWLIPLYICPLKHPPADGMRFVTYDSISVPEDTPDVPALNAFFFSFTDMSQHQGVVKVYFKDKGYGFIESPQTGNIFFHISQVGADDSQRIGINDTVNFEVEPSRKKPGTFTAKNVSLA